MALIKSCLKDAAIISGLIPNSNDHLVIANGITYGNTNSVTLAASPIATVIWNVTEKNAVTTTSNETIYASVDGVTFTQLSTSANTPLDISAYNYFSITASGTTVTVA